MIDLHSSTPPMTLAASAPAPLEAIAHRFLREWEAAHGQTGSTAQATLHATLLTILLERVLTEGELRLIQQPTGWAVVQRHLERLMDQIYPALAPHIEAQLGVPIATSRIEANPETGCLRCLVHLHAPPC